MTHPPFIVMALPRSRTFWLSRFLSYDGWHCGHDEIRHARSMEDVRAWFAQPLTGTAETAGAPWWRLVPPNVRTVIVRRPVADVVGSLAAHGFDREVMARLMTRLDRKLDQIGARVPGVLSVRFEDLATEDGCARVFEHCLPYRHDPAWWAAMARLNLQADLPAMVRYFQAFKPQMDRLADTAKAEIYGKLVRGRSREIEGMTFQQEPFDRFYTDGEALFAKHTAQTGRTAAYKVLNFPMLRMLNQVGTLQITTARSNGRMFGYLMMLVGPSMESEERISATHVTTYASPEVPGLGLKLARAAWQAAMERGAEDALYRVGSEQKKLGAFYRRLGAVHCGEEYLLRLN